MIGYKANQVLFLKGLFYFHFEPWHHDNAAPSQLWWPELDPRRTTFLFVGMRLHSLAPP